MWSFPSDSSVLSPLNIMEFSVKLDRSFEQASWTLHRFWAEFVIPALNDMQLLSIQTVIARKASGAIETVEVQVRLSNEDSKCYFYPLIHTTTMTHSFLSIPRSSKVYSCQALHFSHNLHLWDFKDLKVYDILVEEVRKWWGFIQMRKKWKFFQ